MQAKVFVDVGDVNAVKNANGLNNVNVDLNDYFMIGKSVSIKVGNFFPAKDIDTFMIYTTKNGMEDSGVDVSNRVVYVSNTEYMYSFVPEKGASYRMEISLKDSESRYPTNFAIKTADDDVLVNNVEFSVFRTDGTLVYTGITSPVENYNGEISLPVGEYYIVIETMGNVFGKYQEFTVEENDSGDAKFVEVNLEKNIWGTSWSKLTPNCKIETSVDTAKENVAETFAITRSGYHGGNWEEYNLSEKLGDGEIIKYTMKFNEGHGLWMGATENDLWTGEDTYIRPDTAKDFQGQTFDMYFWNNFGDAEKRMGLAANGTVVGNGNSLNPTPFSKNGIEKTFIDVTNPNRYDVEYDIMYARVDGKIYMFVKYGTEDEYNLVAESKWELPATEVPVNLVYSARGGHQINITYKNFSLEKDAQEDIRNLVLEKRVGDCIFTGESGEVKVDANGVITDVTAGTLTYEQTGDFLVWDTDTIGDITKGKMVIEGNFTGWGKPYQDDKNAWKDRHQGMGFILKQMSTGKFITMEPSYQSGGDLLIQVSGSNGWDTRACLPAKNNTSGDNLFSFNNVTKENPAKYYMRAEVEGYNWKIWIAKDEASISVNPTWEVNMYEFLSSDASKNGHNSGSQWSGNTNNNKNREDKFPFIMDTADGKYKAESNSVWSAGDVCMGYVCFGDGTNKGGKVENGSISYVPYEDVLELSREVAKPVVEEYAQTLGVEYLTEDILAPITNLAHVPGGDYVAERDAAIELAKLNVAKAYAKAELATYIEDKNYTEVEGYIPLIDAMTDYTKVEDVIKSAKFKVDYDNSENKPVIEYEKELAIDEIEALEADDGASALGLKEIADAKTSAIAKINALATLDLDTVRSTCAKAKVEVEEKVELANTSYNLTFYGNEAVSVRYGALVADYVEGKTVTNYSEDDGYIHATGGWAYEDGAVVTEITLIKPKGVFTANGLSGANGALTASKSGEKTVNVADEFVYTEVNGDSTIGKFIAEGNITLNTQAGGTGEAVGISIKQLSTGKFITLISRQYDIFVSTAGGDGYANRHQISATNPLADGTIAFAQNSPKTVYVRAEIDGYAIKIWIAPNTDIDLAKPNYVIEDIYKAYRKDTYNNNNQWSGKVENAFPFYAGNSSDGNYTGNGNDIAIGFAACFTHTSTGSTIEVTNGKVTYTTYEKIIASEKEEALKTLNEKAVELGVEGEIPETITDIINNVNTVGGASSALTEATKLLEIYANHRDSWEIIASGLTSLEAKYNAVETSELTAYGKVELDGAYAEAKDAINSVDNADKAQTTVDGAISSFEDVIAKVSGTVSVTFGTNEPKEVKYGTLISELASSYTETKEADTYYNYEFKNWVYEEGEVITENTVVEAEFTAINKTVEVSGKVVDERGNALSGVTVSAVVNVNGKQADSSTTTDESGMYTFNVPVGDTTNISFAKQYYFSKATSYEEVKSEAQVLENAVMPWTMTYATGDAGKFEIKGDLPTTDLASVVDTTQLSYNYTSTKDQPNQYVYTNLAKGEAYVFSFKWNKEQGADDSVVMKMSYGSSAELSIGDMGTSFGNWTSTSQTRTFDIALGVDLKSAAFTGKVYDFAFVREGTTLQMFGKHGGAEKWKLIATYNVADGNTGTDFRFGYSSLKPVSYGFSIFNAEKVAPSVVTGNTTNQIWGTHGSVDKNADGTYSIWGSLSRVGNSAFGSGLTSGGWADDINYNNKKQNVSAGEIKTHAGEIVNAVNLTTHRAVVEADITIGSEHESNIVGFNIKDENDKQFTVGFWRNGLVFQLGGGNGYGSRCWSVTGSMPGVTYYNVSALPNLCPAGNNGIYVVKSFKGKMEVEGRNINIYVDGILAASFNYETVMKAYVSNENVYIHSAAASGSLQAGQNKYDSYAPSLSGVQFGMFATHESRMYAVDYTAENFKVTKIELTEDKESALKNAKDTAIAKIEEVDVDSLSDEGKNYYNTNKDTAIAEIEAVTVTSTVTQAIAEVEKIATPLLIVEKDYRVWFAGYEEEYVKWGTNIDTVAVGKTASTFAGENYYYLNEDGKFNYTAGTKITNDTRVYPTTTKSYKGVGLSGYTNPDGSVSLGSAAIQGDAPSYFTEHEYDVNKGVLTIRATFRVYSVYNSSIANHVNGRFVEAIGFAIKQVNTGKMFSLTNSSYNANGRAWIHPHAGNGAGQRQYWQQKNAVTYNCPLNSIKEDAPNVVDMQVQFDGSNWKMWIGTKGASFTADNYNYYIDNVYTYFTTDSSQGGGIGTISNFNSTCLTNAPNIAQDGKVIIGLMLFGEASGNGDRANVENISIKYEPKAE